VPASSSLSTMVKDPGTITSVLASSVESCIGTSSSIAGTNSPLSWSMRCQLCVVEPSLEPVGCASLTGHTGRSALRHRFPMSGHSRPSKPTYFALASMPVGIGPSPSATGTFVECD
jgi:hypothetical protein